jgi:DNA-binding beta-propeller fold protein YncE
MGPLSEGIIRITAMTEFKLTFYSGDVAVIGSDPWLELRSRIEEFPVWRWSMTGGFTLWRDFKPVLLDRMLTRYKADPVHAVDLLDSGPFEADSHIFIREWSGLAQPRGIAVGSGGEVYVADQDNHRIAVFDRIGNYLREWGSYGTAAGSLIFPSGVSVASDGTVFVSDSGNHRVQRFTAEGEFLGQFGSEGTGEGEFVQLEGIAAGPDSLLAVCDSGTSSFSVFTLEGHFVGRYPSVLARAVAFDASSNIYTAGCHSGGVTKTDRYGSPVSTLGPDICATGLAVGPRDMIYLVDYDLDRFDVLGSRGTVMSTVGSPGTGPGEFDRPGGIAVTSEGWIYISDTGNGRIQIFAPK